MGLSNILEWTFLSECKIPSDVKELLVNGEEAVFAYKTVRDTAVFTNKRLIIKDAQGITGKKVETYSIPYSSINMWSIENAGKLLDFTSEVELFTRAGNMKIKLGRGLDVKKIDYLLASYIL